MSNYFTDEQIIEVVNEYAGYESNFNKNSKLSFSFDELKTIMNLAVKTAIGEPVAWQFNDESDGRWYVGMNNNNHKQNTIEGGYEVRELYTIKEVE